MARMKHVKTLDAKTATAIGAKTETLGHERITMTVISSGVTSGATVKLQASPDGTNWVDVTNGSITANSSATKYVAINELHKFVRANISAYTDGTHTVYLTIGGFAGVGGER